MEEQARSYADERDLAFFVVNFGYSKREYNELTELEKMIIRKEYETKTVNDMTHLRNAVLNAISNANRRKNKKFIDLFKKKQAKADIEYNKNAIEVILEVEEKEGKSWVDKIYRQAGQRKPQKKRGD